LSYYLFLSIDNKKPSSWVNLKVYAHRDEGRFSYFAVPPRFPSFDGHLPGLLTMKTWSVIPSYW